MQCEPTKLFVLNSILISGQQEIPCSASTLFNRKDCSQIDRKQLRKYPKGVEAGDTDSKIQQGDQLASFS